MELLFEDQAKEFISRLPDINGVDPPATHLMMLAIRSRFARELMGFKVHDLVTERKIVRPVPDWRKRYFDKLYKLANLRQEAKYIVKDVEAPMECKALFATICPRNVRMANSDTMKWMVDSLMLYANDEGVRHNLTKVEVKYFGFLHSRRHPESPKYVTLDVDDISVYDEVLDRASPFKKFMITKTARGKHIVLDLGNRQAAKDFFENGGVWEKMAIDLGKKAVELLKDPQEPIPGTFYFNGNKDKPNYVEIIE